MLTHPIQLNNITNVTTTTVNPTGTNQVTAVNAPNGTIITTVD